MNKTVSILVFVICFLLGVIAYLLTRDTKPLVTPTVSPVPPTETFTPTSTLPPIFRATVSPPSFCHNGPNESYLGAIVIAASTEVEVLAMNSDSGDWFMIRGDGIDTCWIRASALSLSPLFDPNQVLKFITATTIENTPCRVSPNSDSPIWTIIPKGWRIVLYGQNDQETNWVLVVPHDSTEQCWVLGDTLSFFDKAALEIVSAEITSTPTLTPSYTPEPTSTDTPTVTPTETRQTFIIPTSTNTRRSGGGNDDPPAPTNTLVPPPTNTPIPPPTNTPVPPPTSTPIPPPTPIPPTPTLCWPPGHCR